MLGVGCSTLMFESSPSRTLRVGTSNIQHSISSQRYLKFTCDAGMCSTYASICQLTSPSPRPSPSGRGRHVIPLSEQRGASDWPRTVERYSLSLGERAGVRGEELSEVMRV